MRTLFLFLLTVSILGAQAPEALKDEDRLLVQGLAIQLLQAENSILKLSFQLDTQKKKLDELQTQYTKWYSAMLLRYGSKDYVLNAELNWVKKEKPNERTVAIPNESPARP